MNKEFHAATVRELESWPGVTMSEEDGGKHHKVTLHFNGGSRLVVVANTPSDARALPNHIAVVRREIRALGATRAHIVTAGEKAKAAPASPTQKPTTNPISAPARNGRRGSPPGQPPPRKDETMTDLQIKRLLDQIDRTERQIQMLNGRLNVARRAYADRIGQIPPVRIEELRRAVGS